MSADRRFLVACLCAQWCSTCREYKSVFDQVKAAFPDLRFAWIDVEDQADLIDPVDVENFPTVLIARGDQPCFLGPITPQAETLMRLVRSQLEGAAGTGLDSHEARLLAARLQGVLP